jgi:hypothetical protein
MDQVQNIWSRSRLAQPQPIELATCENTVLAFEPISRIVPTTITRITASITAYSAMSWPSSSLHARFINLSIPTSQHNYRQRLAGWSSHWRAHRPDLSNGQLRKLCKAALSNAPILQLNWMFFARNLTGGVQGSTLVRFSIHLTAEAAVI